MSMPIDNLKETWNKAKTDIFPAAFDIHKIISMAKSKKRSSIIAHVSNIAIMATTLVAISIFYFMVMHSSFLLSHTGFGIMFISLAIRIFFEVVSMVRAMAIDITNSALRNMEQTVRFVKQRKQIHGEFTIALVVAYMIGFALMGPEIYANLSFYLFVGIYLFFVVGAYVLIIKIRGGIRKEMSSLHQLLALRDEIGGE